MLKLSLCTSRLLEERVSALMWQMLYKLSSRRRCRSSHSYPSSRSAHTTDWHIVIVVIIIIVIIYHAMNLPVPSR